MEKIGGNIKTRVWKVTQSPIGLIGNINIREYVASNGKNFNLTYKNTLLAISVSHIHVWSARQIWMLFFFPQVVHSLEFSLPRLASFPAETVLTLHILRLALRVLLKLVKNGRWTLKPTQQEEQFKSVLRNLWKYL